jgi:hypothetical protein
MTSTAYPRPTVQELEAKLAAYQEQKAATDARRLEQQTDVSDCALSCWAEGATLDKLHAQLALARKGYMAEFPALLHLDGSPVEGARLVTFKNRHAGYGTITKWVVNHPNGQTEWLPYTHPEYMTPRKAKNLAKKGYKVGTVSKPAHIEARSANFLGARISYIEVAD